MAFFAVVGVALGGCNVGATNQPLTVVEQTPGGTATGGVVATGPAGNMGSAGVGGPCWASELPPEPQAPQPKLDLAEACQLGANAKSWTFPMTSPMKNDDHNGDIVGRWVACGPATVVPEPYAGIEFAGNGRWRLLGKDASGALVPMPTGSYYYLVGGGQLDLTKVSTGRTIIHFVAFAGGNPDVVRFEAGGGAYARVPPSATNGDDDAPSVSDGRCSMVGSWNVPPNDATPYAPASIWSFDDAGHFVVDSPGDDLCGPHKMWGTYQLSDGSFQITQNWNLGLCDWNFAAAYPYKFSDNCSTLTLNQNFDDCTGGRGYLNGTTTLTRRQ